MNTNTNADHGFIIFKRAQNLSLDFLRAGYEGAISFAKAAISLGYTSDDEIIAEACAIAGDHVEARFETLLMEGENIHWLRTSDGQLALLPN